MNQLITATQSTMDSLDLFIIVNDAARFTPKGVEWIAGLWAVHQLRKESK